MLKIGKITLAIIYSVGVIITTICILPLILLMSLITAAHSSLNN